MTMYFSKSTKIEIILISKYNAKDFAAPPLLLQNTITLFPLPFIRPNSQAKYFPDLDLLQCIQITPVISLGDLWAAEACVASAIYFASRFSCFKGKGGLPDW